MNQNTIHQESSFNIIGIAIRTTNKAAAEQGTIAKLWQQFFMNASLSKINNKVDNCIIALYYDFETDKNAVYLEDSEAEYTVLLGARVSTLEDIAPGFIGQHVAAEQRITFTSEIGSAQHIVFDVWKKIWTQQKQQQFDRSFGVDYELYDARSHNPENAQMEIHIGIK